jgi:ABC-type metal ion transport system, periplasmic component/surface adhesin
MISRRWILGGALAVAATAILASPRAALAEAPVKAVASFSILGDIVAHVGGERVEVTTLVGPDGDAHVYQPTPADARAVAAANIVFVNGLGFEGWMDRLLDSAGFKGPVVVVSKGVVPLTRAEEGEAPGHDEHDEHGELDPHAWQNLQNGALYVRNIADALIAVDPAGAAVYRANAERYLAEIAVLDQEVRAAIARLPADRRTIVTSHDAFGYFAAAYGLTLIAPEGVSTESEASAKDVAKLILQIRTEKIPAVFMENITDPRLIEQIRKESGAVVGGTLYSDALSPPDGPAATYLEMFRYNVQTLTSALGA